MGQYKLTQVTQVNTTSYTRKNLCQKTRVTCVIKFVKLVL